MERATRSRLVDGAASLGVRLDAATVSAFARYLELLLKWNARIKLTSVVDPVEVVERHFVDSLSLVAHLVEVKTVVDVGSGAGFPGVPIAMLCPEMSVTLVESIQKKAAFLSALKRELGLARLEVVAHRMEELVRAGRTFEAAVSRATLAPGEWVQQGAALVSPGGRLFAMVVPGPSVSVASIAPGWETRWEHAELKAPYASGRALLVMSGRRVDVPRGTSA